MAARSWANIAAAPKPKDNPPQAPAPQAATTQDAAAPSAVTSTQPPATTTSAPPTSTAAATGPTTPAKAPARGWGTPASRPAAPAVPLERGFRNLGNTCYASVIFHTLLRCRRFHELLSSIERTESVRQSAPLLHALSEIATPYFSTNATSDAPSPYRQPTQPAVDPTGLLGAVSALNTTFAAKGRQQDAEEFYAWMLSSLHEEILRLRSGTTAAAADKAEEDEWAEIGSKKKPIKVSQSVSVVSPIAAIFSGKLRASLRKGVGADTAVLEPFFVLPVDIESADTIVAALAHTFAAESLTDTGKKRAAKRQMMIDEMPPVLSLQLKRFVFDGHSLYKLCHHIAYPLDLTLDKAILSVSLRERAAAAAARTYRLLAVIYHHGEELSRGHYTCIVRVSPDRWVLFDDDRVVPLSSSEATMPRDDRTAYVLIYERPASFS